MIGKKVLITGHTGFKGSWLTAMIHLQGAKVSGIALEPLAGGIFELAELHEFLEHDIRQDIRDGAALTSLLSKISPDVVIHLAAQPLVLDSYENPRETYETNVMGTLNVLQAVEATSSVHATLIVTTDKVYHQITGINKAFIETDPIGSADPYSTSKAMADLLTQSWITSHPESRIAIARAGNVIGGGDVAKNRLLPDLINAFSEGDTALIRNPSSVRPWQHVLDCVSGYELLINHLLSGEVEPGAFNFGPENKSPFRVDEVAQIAASFWGDGANWKTNVDIGSAESKYLTLDSSKSKATLGWTEKLETPEAIRLTIDWSKRSFLGEAPRTLVLEQIQNYLDKAIQ